MQLTVDFRLSAGRSCLPDRSLFVEGSAVGKLAPHNRLRFRFVFTQEVTERSPVAICQQPQLRQPWFALSAFELGKARRSNPGGPLHGLLGETQRFSSPLQTLRQSRHRARPSPYCERHPDWFQKTKEFYISRPCQARVVSEIQNVIKMTTILIINPESTLIRTARRCKSWLGGGCRPVAQPRPASQRVRRRRRSGLPETEILEGRHGG